MDWNEPSISFYVQVGAVPMDEWTLYRVCDDTLVNLARKSDVIID